MDHPVVRWLMGDGRKLSNPIEFLEGFAGQLRAAGIDVGRITTGVPVLHPQLFSVSALWQVDKGASERVYRAEQASSSSSPLNHSPIRQAYEGGGPVRCRLTEPARENEFSILPDLRRDGFTDYIVLSVPFSDWTHKALSLATARPEGFSDADIALFDALVPALAFNLEIQMLRRTARTLLDTYVGRLSGSRVLDGQIRRGTGETIHAVICLCDLRGFTSLSEALPREALIDMLNSYFGPICDAVAEHHGFIGDAMLAIFPVDTDAMVACRNALAAARAAQAALARENDRRLQTGAPRIDYGVALHIGDVMYGNIGSDTRLDFTVIGPAVNLTARIENLCRDLGHKPLLSADFAAASGVAAQSLGLFALKGVGAKQEIFAVRE